MNADYTYFVKRFYLVNDAIIAFNQLSYQVILKFGYFTPCFWLI
jgi:hypothetical protein